MNKEWLYLGQELFHMKSLSSIKKSDFLFLSNDRQYKYKNAVFYISYDDKTKEFLCNCGTFNFCCIAKTLEDLKSKIKWEYDNIMG